MTPRSTGISGKHSHGYTSTRTVVVGLTRILFLSLRQLPFVDASPLKDFLHATEEQHGAGDPNLWLYLATAIALVLLGGVFAGLTIALMGQDGIYLQVIATSGEGKEQRHAQSVYKLLMRGKHWVLVTLLLSNVIVNETLPIVLDRSLGGGWPAVLGSTVLIVIFGEVIPQSVCVRYGMQIGAFMAPFVLLLMYVLAPIAWPTAKLLDQLLGEDHGTTYKKSGLKTLVTLHKTLGSSPSDRLNQDEVTIISAVLDLKDKPVGDIMTPMEDVFTMSADTVLDEKTMDIILSAGYSRIPIYEPRNNRNFVGMLLVKILITYDPEDCKRVSEFALATLPETRPETSCLDIVNFFQEGKSHMVLVSEFPGEDRGATGVVTLEDVIEELIGEEIIDESDVYIDVHKAIRRMAPAPKARVQKGQITTAHDNVAISEDHLNDDDDDYEAVPQDKHRDWLGSVDSRGHEHTVMGSSPKTTFLMRRGSATHDGALIAPIAVRGNVNDMREHLKHLGPSNLASRPKSTRYNTVKIKPGHLRRSSDALARHDSLADEPYHRNLASEGGESLALLNSAGKDASDGVQAIQQGYGTTGNRSSQNIDKTLYVSTDETLGNRESSPLLGSRQDDASDYRDTVESLRSKNTSPAPRKRNPARSGSITENVFDAGGVRKVVLETNSSSDDPEGDTKHDGASISKKPSQSSSNGNSERNGTDNAADAEQVIKKQNKRRRKRKGAIRGEESAMPGGSGQ